MQEKHNIKGLMQGLMTEVVTLQPKDPMQYLVDVLSFDNKADAVQDKHGLSAFRQRKLLEVFKGMDKVSDNPNPMRPFQRAQPPHAPTMYRTAQTGARSHCPRKACVCDGRAVWDMRVAPASPGAAGYDKYRYSGLCAERGAARGAGGTGQSKSGTVSFREVQAHTSRFGGSSLTETELAEIFKHFDSAQDNQVRVCVLSAGSVAPSESAQQED